MLGVEFEQTMSQSRKPINFNEMDGAIVELQTRGDTLLGSSTENQNKIYEYEEEENEEKTIQQSVSLLKLLSTAEPFDWVCMIIGSLAAATTGVRTYKVFCICNMFFFTFFYLQHSFRVFISSFYILSFNT